MSNDFDQKFSAVKQHLNLAFDGLEKAIIYKLEQERSANSNSSANADQSSIIADLKSEIELMKKQFADQEAENKLLKEKNDDLTNKISELKADGEEMISRVKFDLEKIKSVIN